MPKAVHSKLRLSSSIRLGKLGPVSAHALG